MGTASAIATALDPTRLMRAAGMVPDPWQEDLLLSPWQQALLLCSRQVGKSTGAAALATHTAAYRDGATVLILSPSQRQSKETFGKVWAFYQSAGRPGRVEKKSELRLQLASGSRVLALPGNEETVRGFSGVDLLLIDEAAVVADDLYFSIRPMLATSGGRLLALTTPKGKRGWFYQEWMGEGDWKRVKVTARQCPRITNAFLEEERRRLGPRWFAQEYLCQFNELEGSLFRQDDIDAAFAGDFEPFLGKELMPTAQPGTFDPFMDD